MNIKRFIFWACFVIVLILIIWGLIVATHKNQSSGGLPSGEPAPISTLDYVRGPENAPVTLIEYADFQCPACGSYYPIVERLVTDASTTVRFVSRHFPLPIHRNAVLAAQAAEAAGKQGKYWDMVDSLYGNQNSWENLPAAQAEAIFRGYAERLGLNLTQFDMDIDDPAIKAKIDADKKEGNDIGVQGTPTFFINGKAIANPPNYEAFKKLIEDAASDSTD